MGKRGPKPKSESQSNVAVLYGERPKAPKHLSRHAKKLWRSIVDSLPPDRFRVAELFLLEAYCTSSAIHQECVSIISREGLVVKVGKNNYVTIHPAVGLMIKQAATMCSLATKLRLTPQSRISPDKAGREKQAKPSKRPGLMFGCKRPDEEKNED